MDGDRLRGADTVVFLEERFGSRDREREGRREGLTWLSAILCCRDRLLSLFTDEDVWSGESSVVPLQPEGSGVLICECTLEQKVGGDMLWGEE